MSLSAVTIANSIAGLTIDDSTNGNINIRDLDQIIENVGSRDCPILFPNPNLFVSDITPERQAQGSGVTGIWNVTYTLNYVYMHAPIGTTRGLYDVYQGMVTNVMNIVDKILVSDALTGAIDLTLANISTFGIVTGPGGGEFHGCEISFDILEFE